MCPFSGQPASEEPFLLQHPPLKMKEIPGCEGRFGRWATDSGGWRPEIRDVADADRGLHHYPAVLETPNQHPNTAG